MICRFLNILLLAISLTISPASWLHKSAVDPRLAATHKIEFFFMDQDGQHKAACTASALGPHALLTATHCDMGEGSLVVDNQLAGIGILGRIADGKDHTIFLVDGPAFQYTMEQFYGDQMSKVGDKVFFYGDPAGMWPPQYRLGYCSGQQELTAGDVGENMPVGTVYLFAFPTVGGDSGSAIYDQKTGKLISLITYGIEDGKFAGAYVLAFTPAQIDQAVLFGRTTHVIHIFGQRILLQF